MPDPVRMYNRSRCLLAIITMSLLVWMIGVPSGAAQTTTPVTESSVAHGRQATLPELYAMFFRYAAHVDSRATLDTVQGKDRRFYKQHLQTASGLEQSEYALVLESARQFVAADEDAAKQLKDLPKTKGKNISTAHGNTSHSSRTQGMSARIQAIPKQRNALLNNEISLVRSELGQERSRVFESYLQSKYISQGTQAASKQTRSSAARSSANGLQPSIAATPDTVDIYSGQTCGNEQGTTDGGDYQICADAQLSYVSGSTVELYAGMYADWNDVDELAFSEKGQLYVNGISSCSACTFYPTEEDQDATAEDMSFTSGSGVLYQLYSTGLLQYNESCPDDDADTCTITDSHESPAAAVRIYYPDINNIISTSGLTPGSSGTLTIDGEELISPFQNPPTVSVTGSAFSKFSMQSYSYSLGTITVAYQVSANASPGLQTVTVNNGFGAGTDTVAIIAPPPVISGISVSGSTAPNVLQAGPAVQTVTLTGQHLDATSPSITIAAGGAGVTLGTVTSASQTSVSFQVAVASDASASSVTFLLTTGGESAVSPALNVVAMVPPAPSIFFNGANITNSTAQVVIGQQIYLTIALADGSDPSDMATSIDWGVPGTTVAGYVIGAEDNSGRMYPLTQTEQSTITFYWVSPNTAPLTVAYGYCVDVAMQSCTSVTASFVVDGPTGITVQDVGTVAPVQVGVRRGGPWVELGTGQSGDPNYGIALAVAAIHLPSNVRTYSDFQWVQLITSDSLQLRAPSVPGTQVCSPKIALPALDGAYPMFSSGDYGDSPANRLSGYTELWGSTTFKAYLMWDPALGPADPVLGNGSCSKTGPYAGTCTSIPVPVGNLTWSWCGGAVNTLSNQSNNTTYSRSCGTENGDAARFVVDGTFPNWSTVFAEGQTIPQAFTCSAQ